jgi:hypothetical protein
MESRIQDLFSVASTDTGPGVRSEFIPESVTPSVEAGCKSLISICFSKIAGAPIGSLKFLGSK